MSAIAYFAYGSNLLSERLCRRVPSAKALGPGRLSGYRLRFNLQGSDGSAKCNIEPAPGLDVWGVVWSLNAEERPRLDAAERLGEEYGMETVTVQLASRAQPAFTYVGLPACLDDALAPYAWYKAFVVAGAHEHALPPAYVTRLARVTPIADSDAARLARNRDILQSAIAALTEDTRREAVAEAAADLIGLL